MKVNHIRITRRSRRVATLLALLLGLLVVVPVLAIYIGPDRTEPVWVRQRLHCHYVASTSYGGTNYYCTLDLYRPPGSSCPSNVGAYFNPTACVGWPSYPPVDVRCDAPGISCSISSSSSIESCTAGQTGCTMVEQTVTHPPATISGNINCPQTGDNSYCTAAASLSLSGNEPLSGYSIIALEGTHNGTSIFCSGDSCSINLVEGANVFTFWALSDWGDSSLMGNANRSVDTNPPSISGSASGVSGSGSWYVSTVTIDASAADPSPGSGLASFQAEVDGGGWNAYSGPITLNDGNHTVELLATDNAGLDDSESMSFQIDTIAPTTVFTDPTGTTWATGTITLSGVSSDLNLSGAEISYNGGSSWSGLSPDGGGNWSTTWNTQTVSNGSYSVRARGRDQAGNVGGVAAVTIMVDNGEPRIYIPASWPIWRRVAINVVDNGIGVDRVRLTIHGGAYGERVYNWHSGPDDFKWDRHFGDIVAPIGGYPVEVEAWDQVGNKGSAWGEIVIPAPDEVEEEEDPGVLSVEPSEVPPEEYPPSGPPFDESDSSLGPTTDSSSQPPTVITFGDESPSSLSSTANQVAPTTGSNNLLVGALAVTGISYATSLALNQRKRREEEEARKAAAAKQFNARQRALEKKRTQKIAYYRRLRDAAAALYTAGVITAAALFSMSAPPESSKARLESCVDMGGYTKCFQVSPSPISYANYVCKDWVIDICDGDPDNFPRNDTVLAMSDTAYDMLRLENHPEWIVEKLLPERITMLLVAAAEYDFSEDETAYMLATAYGESRFGVIFDDDLDTLPNANMHNGLVENINERDADEDYGGRFGNPEEDGYTYIGRGFCHLTFFENYDRYQGIFGDKYGVNIVEHPEILTNYPQISAEIMAYGMDKGWLGNIELGDGDWIHGTFDNVRNHTGCSTVKACLDQFRVMINPRDTKSTYVGYGDRACLFLQNYDEDACEVSE